MYSKAKKLKKKGQLFFFCFLQLSNFSFLISQRTEQLFNFAFALVISAKINNFFLATFVRKGINLVRTYQSVL